MRSVNQLSRKTSQVAQLGRWETDEKRALNEKRGIANTKAISLSGSVIFLLLYKKLSTRIQYLAKKTWNDDEESIDGKERGEAFGELGG